MHALSVVPLCSTPSKTGPVHYNPHSQCRLWFWCLLLYWRELQLLLFQAKGFSLWYWGFFTVVIPYLWLSLPVFFVPVLFQLFLRWKISISHAFQNAGVVVLYNGIIMILCWSFFLHMAGNAASVSDCYWTLCQKLRETLRACSSATAAGLESVFCVWTGIASF